MLSHSYSILLLLLSIHQIHCEHGEDTRAVTNKQRTQQQTTDKLHISNRSEDENEMVSTSNKQTQRTEHNASDSGHHGGSEVGNSNRRSKRSGSEAPNLQRGSEPGHGGSDAPNSQRRSEHGGSEAGKSQRRSEHGGTEDGNSPRGSGHIRSENLYAPRLTERNLSNIESETVHSQKGRSEDGHLQRGSENLDTQRVIETGLGNSKKESEKEGLQQATKKSVTFDLPKRRVEGDLENLEGNAKLADFELLADASLGSGTFGGVFKVHRKNAAVTSKHDEGNPIYAMKVVDWDLEILHTYPEFIMREVDLLYKLDHPFIAKLHWYFWSEIPLEWLPGYFGLKKKKMPNTKRKDLPKGNMELDAYRPDNTYLFMVMEYYQGGDLKSLQDAIVSTREKEGIQNVFSFTEAQVRFYVAQMILAIECLQDNNIAHRDIKPQNMLIDKQGYLKLADFGLAKDESEFNVSNHVSGTTDYMAPELGKIRLSKQHTSDPHNPLSSFNPQTYTKAVDLWSLGATAFDLLFVQMPFTGKDRASLYLNKIEGNLVIPSKIANQPVSNEFKDLLRGLMNPNPDDRLGNRRNFKETFEKKKPSLPGWISKITSLWNGNAYGMIELLNHQWFKIRIGDSPPIDWEQLKNKKLTFVPYVRTDSTDTFSFRDNHGKGFGLKHTKRDEKIPPKKVIRSHMHPSQG